MKKNVQLWAITLGLGMSMSALAQKDNVGIGTTKPDQSAILDLNSSSKGLLMPRMSLQQRSAIQSPAKGLIVFQTDFLSGFYFFDGDAWKPLAETKENSVAADPNDWTTKGNAGMTAYHPTGNPTGNFLGPTNAVALSFKAGTLLAGYIDPSAARGQLFLGANTGVKTIPSTGNYNVGLGFNAIANNTTGSYNIAIGRNAYFNGNGDYNMAVGSSALFNATSGGNNMAMGAFSLSGVTTGNNNSAVGSFALNAVTTGSNNNAIGYNAGYNKNGSGNVYIGNSAGYSASVVNESNTLYIANSNTASPLIKGEFDNKNLKINLGATKSTTVGFLAVGNFETSFAMPTNNSYRLIVQDGIITEKVKVALKGTLDWADYVFEPSYQLMPLEKVESFVKENKHLPNVPSAEEMSKNGLDVSQTSAKLMEKIEELTLYMIEMNKEIKVLKSENANLKKLVDQK